MPQEPPTPLSQIESAKRQIRVYTTADPRYRKRLWVKVVTPDGPRMVVAWRKVAVLFGIIMMLTWLIGAFAIKSYVQYRNPGAEVSYLNVVFPMRWSHLRMSLGEHYLRLGDLSYALHNVEETERWYAKGLAKAPNYLIARRRLAQIYLDSGRWQQALQTLTPGLRQAVMNGDRDYVQQGFRLLLDAQENSRVLELAESLLPETADLQPIHVLIARMAAEACLDLADYDGAFQWSEKWHLDESMEGQLLLASIEEQRGRPELAVSRLRNRIKESSANSEYATELLRLLRKLGRYRDALQVAEQRVAAEPSAFGPRLDLCLAWYTLGDLPHMQAVVDRYLLDFEVQPDALKQMAEFAVKTAQPNLALQVQKTAARYGSDRAFFDLAIIQAELRSGQYQEALDRADLLLTKSPTEQVGTMLIGLRTVACFGLRYFSEGMTGLQKLEDRPPLPAEDIYGLVRLFEKAGSPSSAKRLMQSMVMHRSTKQELLVEMVRLDLQLNDLSSLVQDMQLLLTQPRPPSAELMAAYRLIDDSTEEQATLRKSIKAALVKGRGETILAQETGPVVGRSLAP